MVQRRLCLIIEIQIMTTFLPPVRSFNRVPKKPVLSWRWDSVFEHQSEKYLVTQSYLYQGLTFFHSGRLRKPLPRKYKTWLNLLKVMSPVDMGIGYDNAIPQSSALVNYILHLVLEPKISIQGGHYDVLSLFEIIKIIWKRCRI